jgi:hypothetical protein
MSQTLFYSLFLLTVYAGKFIARRACVQSYAPYSRCPAGVSLIAAGNRVYSGGYVESAAYNPSLPPLQTAIIDAVVDGMPGYTQVRAGQRSWTCRSQKASVQQGGDLFSGLRGSHLGVGRHFVGGSGL